MRVGIYDPYLDDLGGGEKYMMKIAECLSSDNEVTIFWDNREEIDELIKRFSLDLSKVKFTKNIFSKNISLFERVIKSKNFGAIFVLSDGSIPFLLSKKLFIHFQQPLPFVKVGLKAKFKISRVNKFFCNSYFTKSYIDKEFSIEGFVIYPPVEIKAKKIKKENIILTVGRFRVRDIVTLSERVITGVGDYKKLAVMIKAFKEMFKNGLKGWKFILAVSIKDEERSVFNDLKKEAEGFPIEFLVNKTNDELWDIYSRAKIYWHASGFGEDLEKHPEYAEHFGISTVEAMGAGAVPVVINAGGQVEIVENEKNGFLWNNLEELQKRTLQLINDEALMEKMSKAAMKHALVFSGDRFCKEVREMIEQ